MALRRALRSTPSPVPVPVPACADLVLLLLSWEYGTREQALLELDTPSFSVLTANDSTSVPPPTSAPSSLDTVLSLISTIVSNRSQTISSESLSEPQPFFPDDGSAADPASNGVAALIANWTGQSNSSIDFASAASGELQFLLTKVPRAGNGALSHRVSQVQLWSDFVYMVPPFLAYYAVLTENKTLLEESYNQIAHYRDNLRDAKTGLWMHVVNGRFGGFLLSYWGSGY